MTSRRQHRFSFCFLVIISGHVSAFRFKETDKTVIAPVSSPPGPDLSRLLDAEARSHRDCEERLRKLQLEAASEIRLTEEEREAKCEQDVEPQLHKVGICDRCTTLLNTPRIFLLTDPPASKIPVKARND